MDKSVDDNVEWQCVTLSIILPWNSYVVSLLKQLDTSRQHKDSERKREVCLEREPMNATGWIQFVMQHLFTPWHNSTTSLKWEEMSKTFICPTLFWEQVLHALFYKKYVVSVSNWTIILGVISLPCLRSEHPWTKGVVNENRSHKLKPCQWD